MRQNSDEKELCIKACNCWKYAKLVYGFVSQLHDVNSLFKMLHYC